VDTTAAGAAPVSEPAGGAPRLEDAAQTFLASVRSSRRSATTLATYRAALRCFARWVGARAPAATCADLGHPLADAYLACLREEHRARQDQALSDRSVHEYLVVLKLFARWGARGRRYWDVSPLQEYQLPGYVERDIVPYTREELGALLAAAGPGHTFVGRRLRAMLLVALDTGLRRGELRQLTLEMLDLPSGRVRLPAAITKTRRARTVHVQAAARAALEAWLAARGALPGVDPAGGPLFCALDGRPLTDGAMHELAVRLRVRSGVGRFRWHLIRHTAGTALLRNGADSLDVQEMLGHTTSTMTRRYLHLTDEDRRLRHARYSPVEELLGAPEPRVARFGRRTSDRPPPGRGPAGVGRGALRRAPATAPPGAPPAGRPGGRRPRPPPRWRRGPTGGARRRPGRRGRPRGPAGRPPGPGSGTGPARR
jgi:site-specific recombinase XerD